MLCEVVPICPFVVCVGAFGWLVKWSVERVCYENRKVVRGKVMRCPPSGAEGKVRGSKGDVGGSLVGVGVERFSCG